MNTTSKTNIFQEALISTQIYQGDSLMDLSHQQPLMLVFLRHFGCTFCREVLRDLGRIRDSIEKEKNTKIIIVHMSPPAYAEKMLEKFNLAGVGHITDPAKNLYQSFGLKRGTFKQLFGLRMWTRGFQVGILEGLGVGRERGDGFQMPGYFLLKEGEIVHEYIPKDAADHPEYEKLVSSK